jgi:predicted Zn-dependent protease
MKQVFTQAADHLFSLLNKDEDLILNWLGEKSLFIRFNKSKVRQVSDVLQMELSMTLKFAETQSTLQIPISGDWQRDEGILEDGLRQLRSRVDSLPKLPFYIAAVNNGESHSVYEGTLPDCSEYTEIICNEAANVDLAGILISGQCCRGNANSLGQKHWYESTSFCFDYSLYTDKEKAVKSAYSGTEFSQDEFVASLTEAKKNLQYMEIENKVLKPGKYKCYLAPAAVAEVLGTFSWGGGSQSKLQRGSSPLLPFKNEDKTFSPLFNLKEEFSLGLHPSFNDEGEVANETLDIFREGKIANLLTSTATAKEFDLESNFSNDSEGLRTPVIETGDLAKEDILKKLGTGLYISNLHYLNWSDFNKGRITGMTRFACFYVENGKIIAPIKDLRFDETLYNMWGENLLAITDFAETAVNTDTYFRRGLGGNSCPGLLINDFTFTL